jgi:hypothetical protein
MVIGIGPWLPAVGPDVQRRREEIIFSWLPPERQRMTKPLVGHQLDGQQGQARRRRRRVPIVLHRISVGPVLPRTGSSGLRRPPGSLSAGREGRRRAQSAVAASGANLPRCVDHRRGGDGVLLAVTHTHFVNDEVSASLPALSGAVPDVSWSWLSGCRPGAEEGRH